MGTPNCALLTEHILIVRGLRGRRMVWLPLPLLYV